MDQYIGFDIDDKKTVACVVQKDKKDRYDTMRTEVSVMRRWLAKQRKSGCKLHLTFEVSGQAGWLYDELIESVDTLAIDMQRDAFIDTQNCTINTLHHHRTGEIRKTG